jgi:hypothetical protein
MRTASISSVSVREGGDVDLSALVTSEFLKIVDKLACTKPVSRAGRTEAE